MSNLYKNLDEYPLAPYNRATLYKSKHLDMIMNNVSTPLHTASQNLDSNLIDTLINNGANVFAKNKEGKTALCLAVDNYLQNHNSHSNTAFPLTAIAILSAVPKEKRARVLEEASISRLIEAEFLSQATLQIILDTSEKNYQKNRLYNSAKSLWPLQLTNTQGIHWFEAEHETDNSVPQSSSAAATSPLPPLPTEILFHIIPFITGYALSSKEIDIILDANSEIFYDKLESIKPGNNVKAGFSKNEFEKKYKEIESRKASYAEQEAANKEMGIVEIGA